MPPTRSPHVCQGRVGGGHPSATGTSGAAVGPNAGAAALDTIRPTVGGGAVSRAEAGDLELNAVDGEGVGHGVGV